jgi:hypothetical protein
MEKNPCRGIQQTPTTSGGAIMTVDLSGKQFLLPDGIVKVLDQMAFLTGDTEPTYLCCDSAGYCKATQTELQALEPVQS